MAASNSVLHVVGKWARGSRAVPHILIYIYINIYINIYIYLVCGVFHEKVTEYIRCVGAALVLDGMANCNATLILIM